MERTPASFVDPLRRPEYTGENRCIPCTVVNIGLAAVLGGFVGVVLPPLGIAVFVLSLGLIYLRGYLVPGTPAITKRYLPDRVLRWFENHPADEAQPFKDGLDLEATLRAAGALTTSAETGDLQLTETFQERWRERIVELRAEGVSRRELRGEAGITEDTLMFTDQGDGFSATLLGGGFVGQWESEAALIADLAAIRELEQRHPHWVELSPAERSQLLHGLRVFLEQCPSCDGPIGIGEATVESCCRSIEVLAGTCKDCGARVFERA